MTSPYNDAANGIPEDFVDIIGGDRAHFAHCAALRMKESAAGNTQSHILAEHGACTATKHNRYFVQYFKLCLLTVPVDTFNTASGKSGTIPGRYSKYTSPSASKAKT